MSRIKHLVLLFLVFIKVAYPQKKTDRLTFDFYDTPLQECFEQLEKRSNYRFVYNEQVVAKQKNLTLRSNKVTITKALSKVLAKTNLTYAIAGDLILIKEKNEKAKTLKTAGEIAGYISSDKNGEKLTGAIVKIKDYKAVTDTNGYFNIQNIPIGTQPIFISYIGFFDYVDTLNIEENPKKEIYISIKKNPSYLDEITVRGNRILNPDTIDFLIEERKLSMLLLDGVDRKYIDQSGSITTPEALQRILGVDVSGQRYPAVRGMGDGNTIVMLNEIRLMPIANERNALGVDIIPLNLLEDIKVEKSVLPNRPSEATGGIIILKTKDYPDSLTIAFSALGGINDNTFGDNSENVNIPSLGLIGENIQNKPTSNQAKNSLPLKQQYHFFMGNTLTVNGIPFGVLCNLNYYKSSDFHYGENNFYGLTSDSTKIPAFNALLFDKGLNINMGNSLKMKLLMENEILNLGGMAAMNAKLSPNHILSTGYLFNKLAESLQSKSEGYVKNLNNSSGNNFAEQLYTYRNANVMHTFYLKGNHSFGKLPTKTKIKWALNYNRNDKLEPNISNTKSAKDSIGLTSYYNKLNRSFHQNTLGYSVDFILPLVDDEFLHKFMVGTQFLYSSNFFNQEQSTSDSSNALLSNTPILKYSLQQTIANYYGMAELQFSSVSFLSFGFRSDLSSINTKINTADSSQFSNLRVSDSLSSANYNSGIQLLPSAQFLCKPTENWYLRIAFNKTLSRPNSSDILPVYLFNPYFQAFSIGNKTLINAYAYNIDMRGEWFRNESSSIVLGIFYKYLIGNFERELYTYNNQQYIKIENSENDGQVFGAELEIKQRLSEISNSLKNFTLGYNMLLALSSVKINSESYQRMLITDKEASIYRPVFEQPSYIFNFNIGYDNFFTKTTANIFLNVVGDKIVGILGQGQPYIYELPAPSLDFNISQKLFKGVSLRLFTKNLFDPLRMTTSKIQATNETYLHRAYRLGRQFLLGITYNF